MSDLLPGYSLKTFAYPCGATGFVGKLIVARRFDAARGVWRGINHGKIDLLQLQLQPQSVAEVGESRDVANRFMQRLEQLFGWLVLYTHDVTDQPSAGGCTPEQLRTVLDVARANGVEIDSFAGFLHRLRAPVIPHA